MSASPLVELGKLCRFVSGGTPRRNVEEYFQGDTPWITGVDVTDDVITKSRHYITQEAIQSSATNIVPKGNILLVTRTGVGKVAIAGIDICISQDFTGLLPDRARLDARYLFYSLRASEQYFVANQRGATIQGITREVVAKRQIPLPPLPEQKRIAAVLAKADHLRRQRRYARDLSDTYLQSVFLQIFGDDLSEEQMQIPMGELVTITGGGTPSRKIDAYYTGDIPWLTAKDMKDNYIADTQEHVTEEAIANSATKLVPDGSILLVVKSKILMRRLPLAITTTALCHGQDIKSIQCSEKVNPEFLVYVLKYNEPRLLRQARGANTEGLTLPMLREVPVPDISIGRQQEFARIVHKFERLRAQQREAARQAEHLFQTLLHQAFQGEL